MVPPEQQAVGGDPGHPEPIKGDMSHGGLCRGYMGSYLKGYWP